eukprot:5867102-Pyramimonas_sp.AAC.1
MAAACCSALAFASSNCLRSSQLSLASTTVGQVGRVRALAQEQYLVAFTTARCDLRCRRVGLLWYLR